VKTVLTAGIAVLAAVSAVLYAATPDPPSPKVAATKQLALAKDPASAPALRDALGGADPIVRRLAIYGLQRIGDVRHGEAIRPRLGDADPWVRRTAAVALGELRDRDSVDALVALLDDDSVHLRYDAFLALARVGEPTSQKRVLAALRDKRLWTELDVWDQMALLRVVEREWVTDPDARDLLKWLLTYGTWEHPEFADLEPSRRERFGLLVANRAAVALAMKYGDAAGEKYLVAGLDGDPHMQQRSAMAAGRIRSAAAVGPLIAMLDHEWLLNRHYALRALGEIADPASAEAVAKCLEHPDIRLRRTAAQAYRKITGKKPEADLTEPAAAVIPKIDPADLNTPGGKRPPQFIVLGVDDCVNIEGIEAMLDIVETLRDQGSKAVFTMWVAPLAGDPDSRDMLKQKLIYQRLFDLGCEVAHHTLHHNPGGHNWASLPPDRQIEEIEGCTHWYRDNIVGFTRPFSHKGGGGGQGAPIDREFTRALLARQNFIYRGRRGGHPNEQGWPEPGESMRIPTGCLDAAAPPVHAEITDGITSDYPGRFDYEVPEGVAMWMANFDYHYRHPRRPILAVNAFHDWGFKTMDDSTCTFSHRNEGAILKEFLLEVLVRQKDKYPDTHCVTFRQIVEYVRTDGDLERTLAIGNGQDRRNTLVAAAQKE